MSDVSLQMIAEALSKLGGGFQGPQGYQGVPGDAIQGPRGYQGFQGTAIQGAQGYQGYQGNQGATGSVPWVSAGAYASINAAITAIGSTPAVLVVSSPINLVGTTATPSTLLLVILKGGYIVQTGAYTLTINGGLVCGRWLAFSGVSSGQIKFGPAAIEYVCPEWWYGPLVGTGVDAQPYITCAINALEIDATYGTGSTGILDLATGVYSIGSTITISQYMWLTIRGKGKRSSILRWIGGASVPVILISDPIDWEWSVVLRDFGITQPTPNSPGGVIGVKIGDTGGDAAIVGTLLDNLYISNVDTGVLMVGEADQTTLNKCIIFDCQSYSVRSIAADGSPADVSITDCELKGNAYHIWSDQGVNWKITGGAIQGNYAYGIWLDGHTTPFIGSIYMESHYAGQVIHVAYNYSNGGYNGMNGGTITTMIITGGSSTVVYSIFLGSVDGCNIFGNSFDYYTVAITLSGSAVRNWVGANSYIGLGAKVNDFGTNNVVGVTQ